MTDDKILVELIDKVKEAFANGVPPGYLLNWEEDRFFSEISQIVTPMRVVNETDFNYAFCNRYSIYDTNREYYFGLWISFIADVYSLSQFKRISNTQVSEVGKSESCCLSEKKDEIKQFLTNKNFIAFPESWDKVVVPGIKLELSDVVTLDRCLFEDYE